MSGGTRPPWDGGAAVAVTAPREPGGMRLDGSDLPAVRAALSVLAKIEAAAAGSPMLLSLPVPDDLPDKWPSGFWGSARAARDELDGLRVRMQVLAGLALMKLRDELAEKERTIERLELDLVELRSRVPAAADDIPIEEAP